jgi:hypothetical protein
MHRPLEQVEDRCLLGDARRVHHDDLVRGLGHHAEVVGDEDDGRPVLGLELADEPEDLRLGRHVERCRRLVRDQERGVVDQGHRDHHALAHATRELVRVVVDPPLRPGDTDLPESLDRELPRAPGRDVAVEHDGLHELVADGQDRVQRRHRVLEDHRDLAPAEVAQPALRRLEELLASEQRAARRDRRVLLRRAQERLHLRTRRRVARHAEAARLRVQAEDRHHRHALPRARLADDAEGLARAHHERHAVDRLDDPVVGLEVRAEVAHLEERGNPPRRGSGAGLRLDRHASLIRGSMYA